MAQVNITAWNLYQEHIDWLVRVKEVATMYAGDLSNPDRKVDTDNVAYLDKQIGLFMASQARLSQPGFKHNINQN